MKQIIIEKDNSSSHFLYEQLYTALKNQITSGDIVTNEKLPSIRALSSELDLSVTTIMQAYNQLLAEGYIKNKPGSGYFVEKIQIENAPENTQHIFAGFDQEIQGSSETEYIYDEEGFDFTRWKKCASKIYTDYSSSLLFDSDLKGELSLRKELSKYLFQSRGVSANPDNIIIAAGTQQIAFHLGRILRHKGISLICTEKPGYEPVKSMFLDAGFQTSDIPVTESGLDISVLPVNIPSAVYANPSNQFPTGVVMPAAKRFEILEWAYRNNSFIIEDDYNSELRYFGKPLPTIKSLDKNDRVVYLGSFSSTLFSAIRISYMVLPDELTEIFDNTKYNYSQTCSKAEQLTLAYFMSQGYYYTAIRKKRALMSKKLKALTDAFENYKYNGIELISTNSGLFVTIKINTDKDAKLFLSAAKRTKVFCSFIDEISDESNIFISLYYSFIPLESIELITSILLNKWRSI